MRVHPRGTRFKRAIVAFFHCERSSRKFIVELLPGKNFPTSHPSTVTQLLLERPSASLSYAFLKVSVISRHYNAYCVVRRDHIHNQALGLPAAKSYLSSRRRMSLNSTCQTLSRGGSTPYQLFSLGAGHPET